MNNYNQVFKLFIIISVSLREIISEPVPDHDVVSVRRRTETTAQCQNETAALGALGSYDALDASLFTSGGCDISLAGGLTADCDFAVNDNFQECMDAGGQHHLMYLEYKCDPKPEINVKNYQLCVGASCDIENVKAVARPNLETAISTNLAAFNQAVDPAKCTTKFDSTQYSPAGSTVPGGGNKDGGKKDSGSRSAHLIMWTRILLMTTSFYLLNA